MLISLSVSVSKAQFCSTTIDDRMLRVNENFYMDKYEVSNLDYRQFLSELKNEDVNTFLKVNVKSTYWLDVLENGENFKNYYSSNEAYYNYPVVNISYEAANIYCDWLTEKYNASTDKRFEKVTFRLPTKEEWFIAATQNNDTKYPWGTDDLTHKKGHYLCNFKSDATSKSVLAPVDSYVKSTNGFYNLSGNAAEMLQEKSYAIGGSWNDSDETMILDKGKNITQYKNAYPTIGFRLVMHVLEP